MDGEQAEFRVRAVAGETPAAETKPGPELMDVTDRTTKHRSGFINTSCNHSTVTENTVCCDCKQHEILIANGTKYNQVLLQNNAAFNEKHFLVNEFLMNDCYSAAAAELSLWWINNGLSNLTLFNYILPKKTELRPFVTKLYFDSSTLYKTFTADV